jgi:hypothetical protein
LSQGELERERVAWPCPSSNMLCTVPDFFAFSQKCPRLFDRHTYSRSQSFGSLSHSRRTVDQGQVHLRISISRGNVFRATRRSPDEHSTPGMHVDDSGDVTGPYRLLRAICLTRFREVVPVDVYMCLGVGPGRYCSLRHRIPFTTRNDVSKRVG